MVIQYPVRDELREIRLGYLMDVIESPDYQEQIFRLSVKHFNALHEDLKLEHTQYELDPSIFVVNRDPVVWERNLDGYFLDTNEVDNVWGPALDQFEEYLPQHQHEFESLYDKAIESARQTQIFLANLAEHAEQKGIEAAIDSQYLHPLIRDEYSDRESFVMAQNNGPVHQFYNQYGVKLIDPSFLKPVGVLFLRFYGLISSIDSIASENMADEVFNN